MPGEAPALRQTADYAGSNYYCERTGKETWGAGGGEVMLEL